jgi:hypothetical protein
VVVDLPTLTAKDEDDLVNWGLPNDIDFIAASFVRKGSDLDYIRKVCEEQGAKHLPFLKAAKSCRFPVHAHWAKNVQDRGLRWDDLF